jgi:hypothetical protein
MKNLRLRKASNLAKATEWSVAEEDFSASAHVLDPFVASHERCFKFVTLRNPTKSINRRNTQLARF